MIKNLKALVWTGLGLILMAILIWEFKWLFIPERPAVLPEQFQAKHKALQKVYVKPILASKKILKRDIPELNQSPVPIKEVASVVKVKVKKDPGKKEEPEKEIILFTDRYGNVWKGTEEKLELEQINIVRKDFGFCVELTGGWEFLSKSPYVGAFLFHASFLRFGLMTTINKKFVIGAGAGIRYKNLVVGAWKRIAGQGDRQVLFTVGIVFNLER